VLFMRMECVLVYAVCQVCRKKIVRQGYGNDPGDHDPAYHVAQAYHFPRKVQQLDCYGGLDCRITTVEICWSCGEDWPCPTIKEYGRA